MDDGGPAPRMLDRSSPFKQSTGRLRIRRVMDRQGSATHIRDLFHTLVNISTIKLLLIVASAVVLNWMVFGVLFLMTSKHCGTQAGTYLRALYLAVETVETIGFGIPDPFFNDCKSGIVVLMASALSGSILQALVISLVYTRLSRPQSRATAIVFSDKAVVCEVRGQICFMFQVCDLRKHQLVEAHVRVYCIQHRPTRASVMFQTRAMRLQHPDDELGSMLLLSLPSVVVHRVDAWSPLWGDEPPMGVHDARRAFAYPDVAQRAIDAESGNREVPPPAMSQPTLEGVSRRVREGQLEILCVVEGIVPATSATLQVRHSYTADDLVFNATLQSCVSRAADGTALIDFNHFHEVVGLDVEDLEALVQSMP